MCLGPTHDTFVQGFRESEVPAHAFQPPQEYRESDNFHVWNDKSQEKSLVYMHEEGSAGHQHSVHIGGALTDYKRGVQWRWDFDPRTKSVYNCALVKLDPSRTQQTYCFGHGQANFTKTGSGTIGGHFKIDSFSAELSDARRHIREEIDLIVEAGTSGDDVIPVEEEEHYAMEAPGQRYIHGYARKTYFDFSTAAIPARTFEVPKECPV